MSRNLTPEEFRKELTRLGIDGYREILPVGEQMGLPPGTKPIMWHIEDFVSNIDGDTSMLEGTCVIGYDSGDGIIRKSKVSIYYSQTKY